MAPAEQAPLAPDDYAGIHEVLRTVHTNRYLNRAVPGRFARIPAYADKYDWDSDLSNYDKTYWPAEPNRATNPAAWVALSALTGMRPKTIKNKINSAIDARIDDIGSTLEKGPLMFITGHSPDVFAALPLRHANCKLAEEMPGGYRENHYSRISNTHVVATRGFVPIKFRIPEIPSKKDSMGIVRAAQLVFTPHFTFPRTDTMLKSGIPLQFIERYNARARADCITAIQDNQYWDGLHQLWGMAPSAGPDIKGDKLKEKYPDEPPNTRVIRKVTEGTVKLIQDMNCSIMPVYSKFGKGDTEVQLGRIIPSEQVNLGLLHNIMRGMKSYRLAHSEQNVLYEGDMYPQS